MSLYCPSCGAENRDAARFCTKCGFKFAENVAPPLSSPSTPSTPPASGELPSSLPPAPPLAAPLPPAGAPGMTGMLAANMLVAGRYVIQRRVGRGGMAAVYDAIDTHTNRRVALKEMSDQAISNPAERQQALALFRQEAEMLAQLDHPNLPRVTDNFTFGNKQYLAMDFVDGVTLEEYLAQNNRRPVPEAQVLNWAAQLCDVLQYLHSLNPPVIFRDLKPSNIMIDRSQQVKLIDFGIARVFKPGKKHDTIAMGTPGYAAPEQHLGVQTDARSDIYALGVTLYEMLTGYDPAHAPLPPLRQLNPYVSPVVERVVTQALARDPGQRWQRASDIKFAMTGQLPIGSGPISAAPPGGAPDPAGMVRKSSRPTTRLILTVAQWSSRQIALAMIVLLALAMAALWFGTPILIQYPAIWNNIPTIALIAPLIYAAIQKPIVPSLAHVLVGVLGSLVTSARIGYGAPRIEAVLIAALVTGVFIEGCVRLAPKVRGRDRDAGWKRELIWLMAMAVVAAIVMTGLVWGWAYGLQPAMWLGAVVMSALGWFLGDLAQQYLVLKQTGLKRGLGGRR